MAAVDERALRDAAARTAQDAERGADTGGGWEPVGVVERMPAPRARISRDAGLGWIRRLAPVLRSHGLMFGLALGCALAGMLLRVAGPRVVMSAIDGALDQRTEPLSRYVWILVAMSLGQLVTGFVARRYIFRVAYRVEYDLRHEVFEHLTRQSIPYFDRAETGNLVSRANSDIRAIQMFLTFGPMVSLNVATMLFALAFMATVSVPLTVIAVLPLPLVLRLGMHSRELMFPLSWIVMARQADVATAVEENVSGVRVVRSFAAEQAEVDKLATRAARLRWAEIRQADVNARFSPPMENLPRLGLVAVLIYGGYLAAEGSIGVGALVAFSSYVIMLQGPFRFLGFIVMMSQRAAASASRIFEVLDEPFVVDDRPGAVDLVDPHGDVLFDGVTFGYGSDPAVLSDLTLHVAAGETVALVGATGSGKSTMARLLPRFYDVRDGRVCIDGHDVRDLTVTSLRAHVGVVLDEPFLFWASIRDNIAFGRPNATDAEVLRAADAAQATEFIEHLPDGFDEVIGERGYTLSGGQRQRLALARTLLVNPPVLVLDDATSAIDVSTESRIHDALATLMEARTTLVIAHRRSTIALADRVALLDGGRIVAEGTHDHLMATEVRYRELLDHLVPDSGGDD